MSEKRDGFRMFLPDSAATEQLAKRVSTLLHGPMRFALSGDIGMGKTTFVRALLRALGCTDAVKSPTFSLVEAYELPGRPEIFYHFDWYRLETAADLEGIGWRDYCAAEAICCVEWPERVPQAMQQMDVQIRLTMEAEGRSCAMIANTPRGEAMLQSLMS